MKTEFKRNTNKHTHTYLSSHVKEMSIKQPGGTVFIPIQLANMFTITTQNWCCVETCSLQPAWGHISLSPVWKTTS